ncbi:MAG: Low specificity L-threonine aldolase [Alphaproteobacteria bacterium MarineAlpha9_Bin3]|nr:MAG: Low specificity L-threonine aldolase [Alphaproteobacteria bacterium MarineAlpha9_Bin3]|tara:strand:+ start:3232 stop:4257 length:1026 start_codon:yes stop_codon:yes gene_type:complete
MNFQSDNQSTIFPEIIEYLNDINNNSAPAYGADEITLLAKDMLVELFETDLKVMYVSSGTAANSIALSAISPPYGGILCSDNAHIGGDECGAPEFFTGGSKLVPLPSKDGLMLESEILKYLDNHGLHGIHEILPSAISITQASELGTVYSQNHLKSISDIAKKHSLYTHMDGARFANACCFLKCKPADITWKSGIDILSLGTTKNGTMSCEAIVIFNKDIQADFERRQKRAGHLWSKNRYMAAQIVKWIENDRWKNAANKANDYAKNIKNIFNSNKKILIEYPVDINMVFAKIPPNIQEILIKHNVLFNPWYGNDNLTRFVTSWDTKFSDIKNLEEIINNL